MLTHSSGRRWHSHLYVQTLIGVALGIVVGALFPKFGAGLKPLGEGFINLIKMMIGRSSFARLFTGSHRLEICEKSVA